MSNHDPVSPAEPHRGSAAHSRHSSLVPRPSSRVRACLITNPRSGHGGIDLTEVLPVLEAQGWEVAVRQKMHGGMATELAREAAREGYDMVVGCGGDGTLSEIVDGLAGTDVAMGALPGGTENVWARELGISTRLRVAARQLVGAERRRVDTGHVTINGRHGRHFLLMAGLGADGAVMTRVSKPLKNRIGPLAVGLATVQALPALRAVPVRVELDGLHWQGRVSQVVVGNTRLYGGFTAMTPDALVDDGLLDVCLFTATGAAGASRQLASLVLRHQPSAATAETYRVARVVVRAPTALPLQIDGGVVRLKKREEPGAEGIVYTFSVVSHSLSVLVPRTYDGALFAHVPVQTAAAPHAESRHTQARGVESVVKGKKRSREEKEARQVMAVAAIGVDSITAVRVATGRVVTVRLSPETVVRDEHGTTLPVREVLANLAEGRLVRVKGKKDADHGTISAGKIWLLGAEGGAGPAETAGDGHDAPDEEDGDHGE